MYILNTSDQDIASRLAKDVESELRYGKHELLMEAIEENQTTRIYIVQNDSIVSDLILLSRDGHSTSYISITGEMPLDELSKMIK